MASLKLFFFGSLFTFQPVAVEELRKLFQQAFSQKQLAGDVPLISYDQKNSSFSFQCEQSDTKPVQLFRALLRDYINEHQAETDLLENQRIIPIYGTVFDDHITSNDQFSLDSDEGLVPFSDEEDSETDECIPGSAGFQTLVWKPSKGSVELLTFDIVKALSDRTACKFSVNPHRNEVRLYGGAMSHALSSLTALEAVMLYLHNPANAHILMLYTATDNTRIDFTIPSDNALRRIIVDPDVKSVAVWLGNKRIEQLATYIKGAKAEQAFATPSNLTTPVQCSAGIEVSAIWSDFTFAEIGDVGNKAPLGKSLGFGKIEKLDPLPVSHYMSEKESHMIEQWAGRVVETADPNDIIPEAPLDNEGQKKVGRIRKVKQAEDDEIEEDDDQDHPSPFASSVPQSMNDALNLQFETQRARSSRRRVKKLDEDEDEEESRDNMSTKGAKNQNTWIYPSSAEPSPFGFRSLPPRKRSGRQRIVKADSDDECEDVDTNSPLRQQERSSESSYDSQATFSPARVDENEMSNDRTDSVHPHNFCSVAPNVASEQRHKPTDLDGLTDLQTDPIEDRWRDLKPASTTEGWSDFAAASSDKSRRSEMQTTGRGQGTGRSDEGQGQESSHRASIPETATSSGHSRSRVKNITDISNQQPQGLSNRRGIQVSQFSVPHGRDWTRGDCSGRDDNKFGLLAADALIEIPESDFDKQQTLLSLSEYGQNQGVGNQSTRAIALHDHTHMETPKGNLIDVSTPETVSNRWVAPPPGFESLSCTQIQGQSSNQSRRSSATHHESSSAEMLSQSVPSMPDRQALYVDASNPGMNLIEISRRRMDQLHRTRRGETSNMSVENIQEVDESSTRIYHRTMNQQTRKPMPKKKVVEQKKTEVVRDAWGTSTRRGQTKVHGLSTAPAARKAEGSENSSTKEKLLRGKSSTAESHTKGAHEAQKVLQNDQFVAALAPVFKAARAFPGVLKFEVQLGQFLSPSPEGAYQSMCVTVDRWHKLYDSAHGSMADAATFTNIVTRNGADVDHILRMKTPGGGKAKLFHHDRPGRLGVRFDFHCQGKNNDEFKLVLSSKGECEIERPFRKIGQLNLHVPGQVWDAAALFTGCTRFPEEEALKDAAKQLANSIYIPGGRTEIEISYKLPASNEFAVKRVVMKRVSRHMCALIDKEDVQLQITEVQRLFVERRPDSMYFAYASKYERMVEQMMIHFEVSLLSESVECALAANTDLAVGDVTAAWTEDSLLQKWRTKNLLEMTHMVVSKIDGIGCHNVGSAVFFLNQDSVLAGGSALAIRSQMPNQSTAKVVTHNAQATINVPGVRGGVAQPATQGYVLGYGGARIPIPKYGEPIAVVPDDSASQAPEREEPQTKAMLGFW